MLPTSDVKEEEVHCLDSTETGPNLSPQLLGSRIRYGICTHPTARLPHFSLIVSLRHLELGQQRLFVPHDDRLRLVEK